MSSQYGQRRLTNGRLRSVRELGALQQISRGFASCLRYYSDVAHWRPTKLSTMFGVSWAGIHYYIHFRGLCTWHNSVTGQDPQKCIYSVPSLEAAKHRAKFGWPPSSDVDAITKPRRESGWNLLGCPKLANGSQPLEGRSAPYCQDMWRRYWRLTIFSDCRYMPYLGR